MTPEAGLTIWRIARFWLLVAAASLAVISGLLGVGEAVHRWTASPLRCRYGGHLRTGPLPLPLPPCRIVPIKGGLTAWAAFGVGLGFLVVGACLFLLARRVKRRRDASLALG
jgi:hypothetical protein